MTATVTEAPSGASGLSALLEREPAPLTAVETGAIVRDFLASTAPPRRRLAVRACRCDRPWTFERGHCAKCGHELRRSR